MTGSPSGMSHVTTAEFAFTALMVTLTGGDRLSANRGRDKSSIYPLRREANEEALLGESERNVGRRSSVCGSLNTSWECSCLKLSRQHIWCHKVSAVCEVKSHFYFLNLNLTLFKLHFDAIEPIFWRDKSKIFNVWGPVCCVALLKCWSAIISIPSREEDSDWLCWSPDVYLVASWCAHLCFRMKYLDIDWRRCCEIGNRYFCPPSEESESPLWLSDSLDHISIRTLLPCEKRP